MATSEPTVRSDPDATQPISRTASDDAPRRGQLVGRYIVLGTIGKGAMGVVLRAYDPQLDRRVALKLVRRTGDHRSRARLVREAQTLAKLSHANVVTVFDVGSEGDDVFLAMELIDGHDLAAWLRACDRSWREVLEVFLHAGVGLHAAHCERIVHRDFKPANVMIAEDPRTGAVLRVAVGDFGLARPGHGSTPAEPDPWGREGDAALTHDGVTVGTPAYMAPEQHFGRPAGPRADQYAFAVALYEGLFGARPFLATGATELARQKSRAPPPPTAASDVPRALWGPIARALSPSAGDRFATMGALLDELRRAADGTRRRWLALGLAAAELGAALVIARPWAAHVAPCTAAGASTTSVWNEDRRATIEQTLVATAVPFASETAARVRAAIDARVGEWQAARHEACVATWIRGEQSSARLDLRMACLDRELERLDAQLAVLGELDASNVERAPQILAALPSLGRCAEPSRLEHEPASDPQLVEPIARARRELLAVDAALVAGRPARVGELLEALSPSVLELGDRALRAELGLTRARWRDQSGDPAGAAAALRETITDARASGHRRVEAEAWILFVLVTSRTREPERGRFYGRLAASTIVGLAGADELAGDLATKLGLLAFTLGEDDVAEQEYRRGLELRERVFGPEHPKVADVLAYSAGVELRRGQRDDARASLERALAIQRAEFGLGHPKVAVSLGNLGIVLAEDGQFDAAIAVMQDALRILEGAYGAEHPAVANATDSIGDVLRRAGKLEEAQRSFTRAIGIYERTLGPDSPALASALLGAGQTSLDLGRVEEARPLLVRALGLAEANPVPPVQLAETAFALARALGPDERARAIALAERARAIYVAQLLPQDDRMPELDVWLATVR